MKWILENTWNVIRYRKARKEWIDILKWIFRIGPIKFFKFQRAINRAVKDGKIVLAKAKRYYD